MSKCVEKYKYSPVLQVSLMREQYTLPIPENTRPFSMSHRSTVISAKKQTHFSVIRAGSTITLLPSSHMTICTISGSSQAGRTKIRYDAPIRQGTYTLFVPSWSYGGVRVESHFASSLFFPHFPDPTQATIDPCHALDPQP